MQRKTKKAPTPIIFTHLIMLFCFAEFHSLSETLRYIEYKTLSLLCVVFLPFFLAVKQTTQQNTAMYSKGKQAKHRITGVSLCTVLYKTICEMHGQ